MAVIDPVQDGDPGRYPSPPRWQTQGFDLGCASSLALLFSVALGGQNGALASKPNPGCSWRELKGNRAGTGHHKEDDFKSRFVEPLQQIQTKSL